MTPATSSSSRRILVVDDNRAIHDDFRRILCPDQNGGGEFERSGAELLGGDLTGHTAPEFQLDFACQGEEALQMVRQALHEARPYMLAFIDARMPPGWDGIETTAKIWEVDCHLQVVICSAHADYPWEQVGARLHQPDQFAILKKPFDIAEVRQLANAFTEKWRLMRAEELLRQTQADLEKRVNESTVELGETRARLEHLLRSNPAIIYSVKLDAPQHIAFVSGNVSRVLGYEPAEFTGNPGFWREHLHPEDASRMPVHPSQLPAAERQPVEYRFRLKDGSCRWIRDEARVVRDARGNPVEIVGFWIDVTDRKKAEEALRQSEERIRMLVSSVTDYSLIMLNAEGRVASWNSGAERIKGYAAHEIVGKHFSVFYPPEDLEQDKPGKHLNAAASEGRVEDEGWRLRKDGTRFWASMIIAAVRDGSGGLRGFSEVTRDITELRRAEGALRLQTSALKAAANGIVITDRAGRIVWVNPAFTRLTGYSAAEAIGKTSAVLKSGAQDKTFYETLWQTILAGKVWQGEIVNRRKDGTRYCEEMTITPVLDSSGGIQHFIAIKQDVSPRKQFEQVLARERDLLRALLDNSPDRIYFRDLQSRFVRVSHSKAAHMLQHNPQLRERLSRRRAEAGSGAEASDAELINGLSLFDVFTEEHARLIQREEQQIICTGQPIIGKVEKQVDPDGSTLWSITSKLPWHDKEGRIIGTFGISKDVTALMEAEARLASEQELFRTLLDNVPDFIYFKDAQSRFTRVNNAQARLMNLGDPTEAIGKTNAELCPSGFWHQALVDEQRVFITGEPMIDVQEQIRTTDGSTLWVSSTKVPVRNSTGNVTGLIGISRGITERKLAEEQLAYERELLRALMESSPDLIYFKDRASRFLRCSRTMAERFGVSRAEDLVGKSDFDFFTDEHARPAFEDEQGIIRTGRPVVGKIEQEFYKSKADVTWVLTNKLPLRDRAGQIIGTFGISKDITAMKQAEQTRQIMEAQLRQSQKLEAIGQLAAGIAQEINTPTQQLGDNTRFLKNAFESIATVLLTVRRIAARRPGQRPHARTGRQNGRDARRRRYPPSPRAGSRNHSGDA